MTSPRRITSDESQRQVHGLPRFGAADDRFGRSHVGYPSIEGDHFHLLCAPDGAGELFFYSVIGLVFGCAWDFS
ncbi:MAG TPA: hypothetical protein EYM73_00010 [Dehalococcoidia bacterium]|nr:hypothetical protein [Dehalococcoidia bacterium]